MRASVVLPDPGRPEEDRATATRSASIARRSARPGPTHVLLADELVERRRPQPLGERRDGLEPPPGGLVEEIAHIGSMLRGVGAR